ncbi:hypothetical protein D3C85_1346290 [compost metagenome]
MTTPVIHGLSAPSTASMAGPSTWKPVKLVAYRAMILPRLCSGHSSLTHDSPRMMAIPMPSPRPRRKSASSHSEPNADSSKAMLSVHRPKHSR